MIAVSPGDWDHSKTMPSSEDRGPECGCAVCKDEDSVPNACNLAVVEQAKSGDGKGRDQSYPKCSLMRENSQSNTQQRGWLMESGG